MRLGLEPTLSDFLNEDGTVPAYSDKGKPVPLRSDGIVWWDEVHKECFIGDYREGSKTQTQFPRDPDGTYNPDGEYRDEKQLLTVKYPKQGRFCLGIGIVDRGDGPKGERIELFDYTSKNIITIKTKNEMIESSIRGVKKLPLDSKYWTSSNRKPGAFYLDDPVTKVDGVSGKKQELLTKAGIMTIQDLVGLDDAEIKRIAKSTKGLGVAGLTAVVDASRNVLNESAPETIYYIEAENPWAAKYGTEKDEWGVEAWEAHLKKTSAFSGGACITDLVQWIASKSRDLYAGTERKDDWHFYHNALSQLTAAKTITWMKVTIIPGTEISVDKRRIKP